MQPIRVTALVLACACEVLAQQSVDFASISGRVADASGAMIPGANVNTRHLDTNVSIDAVTDHEGRFRFPYLRVGSYELTVTLAGFRTARQRLDLTTGAAFELPITLQVAGLDATVSVSAETTVLDAARSQIAITLSTREVEHLPANGRSFVDLALLAPGVSPTNVGSTQLFPETSAVAGATLSVGSQRNLSNNFIVDGMSANDDAAGLSGITYGLDAIAQLQVVTSGAQAELGRALGGYVTVLTKSGTNTRRGSMYEFFRDDALNARNALLRASLPMQQSQYGGSLGGPLRRDRTFFFTNIERRQLDQTGLVTISRTAADVINARLRATGYGASLVETGVYENPLDTTNLLGKIDHHLSGANQLSVRYVLYSAGARNARGAGALNAPSASSGLDNVDHSISVGNTLMLSPRVVMEARGQFAYSDLHAPPSDLVGPSVGIAGVATFGRLSSSPTARRNRMYQAVNNLSAQFGAHALRIGGDLLFNDGQIVFPRAVRGSYTFSSLADFLSGTYNNAGFTQTFGATEIAHRNPNAGVYVQDEWKVASDLTVNLGLRYDLQFLGTIDTDVNNVSPRIGIAWSPTASRRTIVRGGAGLYYDRVPLRALANALLSAGNTTDVTQLRQISISLSPSQAGAPVFPQLLSAVIPSVTLPNLTTMDRDLRNAYSRQANVEIEQQFNERTTVSVGYHYLRGIGLLMSINQNVPTCVASGTNNGCRPNASYGNNSQYSSAGTSNYHGVHVSFVQRATDWGHYRVSYTLSKSMNNVGEFFFSAPIDPLDLSKDWGRSDDDQRHRLVISGAVRTPTSPGTTVAERLAHGWQVSGVVQAYSALPLNITSGVTTIQGTAGRPMVNGAFIPRNAGTGSDFFSVNARVSRVFPLVKNLELETLIESFNLTNRQNAITRNGNFGSGAYPTNPSPTFGQVTAVGEPRSLQLGARLRF